MLHVAEAPLGRGPVAVRVAVAGLVLAGLAFGSAAVFGDDLALGSGYRTMAWVTEPGHSLALVVALFVLRLAATAATVAGGGVGGLFVPLVIAGAVTGRPSARLVPDQTTLFPLIGVAAFLGAGYRTPLAGVMFVAETTGRPASSCPGSSPRSPPSWSWARSRCRRTRPAARPVTSSGASDCPSPPPSTPR